MPDITEMKKRLEVNNFMAKLIYIMERTELSVTEAVYVVISGEWPLQFKGKINIPRPPPCGKRSAEVGQRIFETSTNAMIFSEHIETAFKETKIELEDDETFACHICVVKKPTYISEVVETAAPIGPMMTSDSDWSD
jgi:hypothetical protein